MSDSTPMPGALFEDADTATVTTGLSRYALLLASKDPSTVAYAGRWLGHRHNAG
jgi:hypothetical protein